MPNIKRIPFIQKRGDKEVVIQPTKSRPAQGLDDTIDEVEDRGGLFTDEEKGDKNIYGLEGKLEKFLSTAHEKSGVRVCSVEIKLRCN